MPPWLSCIEHAYLLLVKCNRQMFLLGLPHREAASMEGDGGLWEGKPEMLGHRCAMQGCCVPCPDPPMPWYLGCVAVPLLGPVLRRMGATMRAHHPLWLLLSMDMADDRWAQKKGWPPCFRKAQSVVQWVPRHPLQDTCESQRSPCKSLLF